MSSTRHITPGIPFRQERFASAEAYRSSLNALLVAKRCALLRHDPELRDLIWLIQEQSLADPYNVGNRTGSIDQVADDLLALANYAPAPRKVYFEDLDTGETGEREGSDASAVAAAMRADLVRALCELALDPREPAKALPGLGVEWRKVLVRYREQVREKARQTVAATSAFKSVLESLRFTSETGMPSLTMGVSRLGKSATAKAFCAASGGLARYVLTPEDTDMGSLYRATAKAVGVADSPSMKAEEVRERVERTIHGARLMLVFDEAHNLFNGGRRVVKPPQRILWLRRLIDGGVPVAFVALEDFKKRIARYVDQLDWDAAQITDIIARETTLAPELKPADFELLVARLAGDLPASCKTLIASAAKAQRGAQYVADIIDMARHAAAKAGRDVCEEDVAAAIGSRPQFRIQPIATAPAPRRAVAAPQSARPAAARAHPEHITPAPSATRTAAPALVSL